MVKKIEQAHNKYEQLRRTLNKLIDQKLSEHSMSYYIREKGIGSKSIQDLKHRRDKMQIESIIKALYKMS